MTCRVLLMLSIGLFGCGGSDSPPRDTPDAADIGNGDAGNQSPCGFDDRFLPYQAGYTWEYRVTDLAAGTVATKSQALTDKTDPDLGAVIEQVTTKANGRTISAVKVDGDVVLRLRQQDYDQTGALERTTSYDPGQVRLDHATEHVTTGAKWDDSYNVTITDETGTVQSSGAHVDHWEVLGENVVCSSPLGNFSCLHLHRVRTTGGLSDKQYFFAKGIGKVKEVNANQVEELVSCGKTQ